MLSSEGLLCLLNSIIGSSGEGGIVAVVMGFAALGTAVVYAPK